MAIIYNNFIHKNCIINFGQYTSLNWKVFLIFENDDFIFFSKNHKLGFANKKEIHAVELCEQNVNNSLMGNDHIFSLFSDFQQYFANKICKIQTVGTFWDVNLVRKIKISTLQPCSLAGNIKDNEVIIDANRIVYVLEN